MWEQWDISTLPKIYSNWMHIFFKCHLTATCCPPEDFSCCVYSNSPKGISSVHNSMSATMFYIGFYTNFFFYVTLEWFWVKTSEVCCRIKSIVCCFSKAEKKQADVLAISLPYSAREFYKQFSSALPINQAKHY